METFHQLGRLQAQRDHKQLVAFGCQQSHLVGVVNELVEVAEPHEGIRPVEVTCTNRRLLDTGSRSELESAAAPYRDEFWSHAMLILRTRLFGAHHASRTCPPPMVNMMSLPSMCIAMRCASATNPATC